MTTITTIDVTGMTCGHCVSAVTRELEQVDGVERVSVELANGGTSHVTVFSDAALAEQALREAVDEAGYDVTGVSSHGAEQEYAQLADTRAEVYGSGDGPGPARIQLITRDEAEAPGEATGGSCGCGGCGCS